MDKKTVIAFILIGLVLILTQTEFYKQMVLPERPTEPMRSFSIEDTLKKPELPENQQKEEIKERPSVAPETAIQKEQKRKETTKPPLFSDVITNQDQEEKININTPLYDAVISTKGGGVLSWKLKKYLAADSQLVEMMPTSNYGNPAVGMVIKDDTLVFNEYQYEQIIEGSRRTQSVVLNKENNRYTIKYLLEFQEDKKVQKTYTFHANKYYFDLNVQLEGFSGLSADRSYQMIWKAGLLPTEKPIKNDLGHYKIYAYLGEDLQDFNVDEDDTSWKKEEVTGIVNWAALRTKYFVSSLAPMNNKGRSIVYKGKGIPYTENERFKSYNYAINIPLGEGYAQEDRYNVYLGPLEYNGLKELDFNLQKLILGSGGYERLFRPFSMIILRLLKFFHGFISNYGIVIIVFSILIKIVLYPLTHKSYVSMKKMQLVQPKMTELREKHKDNPQQLNRQMMKLYKDYGVNPMGGCLPMLLQMPLLIGLFIVFRSTIELRGAEFFWWITDLSKPDTIFTLPFSLPLYGNKVGLLPLIMGATMFLQQKSTMQDPRQKMMMYFMPIFFVLLFNSFPSGLNLYYTLFNLFTIIQQKFIKMENIQVEMENKKKKKEGQNKKIKK